MRSSLHTVFSNSPSGDARYTCHLQTDENMLRKEVGHHINSSISKSTSATNFDPLLKRNHSDAVSFDADARSDITGCSFHSQNDGKIDDDFESDEDYGEEVSILFDRNATDLSIDHTVCSDDSVSLEYLYDQLELPLTVNDQILIKIVIIELEMMIKGRIMGLEDQIRNYRTILQGSCDACITGQKLFPMDRCLSESDINNDKINKLSEFESRNEPVKSLSTLSLTSHNLLAHHFQLPSNLDLDCSDSKIDGNYREILGDHDDLDWGEYNVGDADIEDPPAEDQSRFSIKPISKNLESVLCYKKQNPQNEVGVRTKNVVSYSPSIKLTPLEKTRKIISTIGTQDYKSAVSNVSDNKLLEDHTMDHTTSLKSPARSIGKKTLIKDEIENPDRMGEKFAKDFNAASESLMVSEKFQKKRNVSNKVRQLIDRFQNMASKCDN